MIANGDPVSHEEAWLALPWLANGRLSQAERDPIERHLRDCAACREELASQRLLCNALTEPDRVSYAPGPSFRKLMDRIDAGGTRAESTSDTVATVTPIRRDVPKRRAPSWRPPGLAWAASFVLAVGLVGVAMTVYRASQPLYVTHTEVTDAKPNVLHIAFDRTVTVGAAEEVLHATGARIVEGPDGTGIFGVTLVANGDAASDPGKALRALAERLRTDPHVRWVEPIAGEADTPPSRGP